MKAKVSWKLLLAILAIVMLSSTASAQFGGGKGGFGGGKGGFGGKGGGGFDPAKFFDSMAKGKDYIDLNDLSPWMKPKLEEMAKKNNITNGKIPRDVYIKATEERMKSNPNGGGGSGGMKFTFPGGGKDGGGNKFGTPGGNGGPPFGKGDSGKGDSGKGDSGKGGPPFGKGGPFGGKGGDNRDKKEKEKETPEQTAERVKKKAKDYFDDRDDNKDGKLNTDEMSRTLKEHYKKYDKNNDNMISLEEATEYMWGWEKGDIGWRNNNNNNNKGGNNSNSSSEDSSTTIDLSALEERPEVFVGGKLPSGLPGWFAELDTDKDGQVGLYEWFAAKKDVVEFKGFDRNGDGFVTFEEVLYHQQIAGNNTESTESPGATISSSEGNGNGGNGEKSGKFGKFGGFNGFGKGGKERKKGN